VEKYWDFYNNLRILPMKIKDVLDNKTKILYIILEFICVMFHY